MIVIWSWTDDNGQNITYYYMVGVFYWEIRPRPHVSRYFWIRKFFFADLKIVSTSTHSVFKSNLPVHTYPDSLSPHQLICEAIFGSYENFLSNLLQYLFRWQNCHTEHNFARLTCLRRPICPSDIKRCLRMSSRRLVLLKCTVIIARFNFTHVIRIETDVQEVKKR